MEKDTYKTKVVFRMWDGQVIALFPEIDEGNYFCLSYEHIGQHGGADYQGIVADSRLATPDEYKDLFEELESIGYNLDVRKRR
jgi:hypothetical protein